MNEEIYFRATLDSMTGNQLARLVNIAERLPVSFCDPWTWAALAERGLVISRDDWGELLAMSDKTGVPFIDLELDNQLTDYGAAFVAWYRQPHDTPQQMELF